VLLVGHVVPVVEPARSTPIRTETR